MANFVSNDNATSLMNAINQKKDSKPGTITWAEWIALTDEQREGTHYIITNVPAKFSDKDAVFSIKDETLEFTNKTATVTDSRITADTYIFTFYHNQAVAQAAGIECSWTTGTVTFTVDENPSEDIVVDILCILPALATPKEDITAEDVSYDSTKNVKQKIDEKLNSGGHTINKVLITNDSGEIETSSVSDTELGYLSGVTSGIQTQLDAKAHYKSLGSFSIPVNGTYTIACGKPVILVVNSANPDLWYGVFATFGGWQSNVAVAIIKKNLEVYSFDGTNLVIKNTNTQWAVQANAYYIY